MKYTQPKFSVHSPGTEQYRSNWDAIFAKKTEPTPPQIIEPARHSRLTLFDQIQESLMSTMRDIRMVPPSTDDQVQQDAYQETINILKIVNAQSVRSHVREFHRVYDAPINDYPCDPGDDQVRLRLRLVTEEYLEFLESTGAVSPTIKDMLRNFCDVFDSSTVPYDKVDLVAMADALADLDYVIEGTRLVFGIDGAPIANEVHRSNLSKLGADGKPIRRVDGKVLKGPNYSPPDVLGELRKQGYVDA